MNISATINDIDDNSDDDDSDFDPTEETLLETYTTPIDDEDCEVDEYEAFKQVMTGKDLTVLNIKKTIVISNVESLFLHYYTTTFWII